MQWYKVFVELIMGTIGETCNSKNNIGNATDTKKKINIRKKRSIKKIFEKSPEWGIKNSQT